MKNSKGVNSSLGRDFLFFALGILLGVPIIIFGVSFFADNVKEIAILVLIALVISVSIGTFIALFKDKILQRIYGVSKIELEEISKPIESAVAGLLRRDSDEITSSLGMLTRLILARISWFETRRWVIGTSLAIVAAFAGLAGSTLLFHQNELIRKQNLKFDTQNERLGIQNSLLEHQITLSVEKNKKDVLSGRQMYTFDFLGNTIDDQTFQAIRATIGLRQLRDLYEATDYGFFSVSRMENVHIMYAVRNWFYQEYYSVLMIFIDRIERCISSGICQPEVTLLQICPYIDHMVIRNEHWLTWDKKREPNADPITRLHMNKLVKKLAARCPDSQIYSVPQGSDIEIFRSSASYGEAKRLLRKFESAVDIELPNDKAQKRDNSRLRKIKNKPNKQHQ